MSASNSQPARRGGAASPHTHGPTVGGMPATSMANHGNPLAGTSPAPNTPGPVAPHTPAPTGGKRKHPAEGKPLSPGGFGA